MHQKKAGKLRQSYLSTCDMCEWYKLCADAASVRNAQRAAERHSEREPGHRVAVINLQRLVTVTIFQLSAIEGMEDPPF